MSRRRTTRARHGALLAVGALVLVGTSGTALTAGIMGVPAVSADHYVGSVVSFTAGSPTYSDPGSGTIVTFSVTPAAGQVRARVVTMVEPSRPYETCSTGGGTTWTCPVPGLSVDDATAGTFQWTATS